MFRRTFALALLGGVLAAGPALAQNQGYSVWAHRGGYSGGGFRQAGNVYPYWPGIQPDEGRTFYGAYRPLGSLGDFSHYTDPYDSGYGGRVNADFTISKDMASETPATATPLAAARMATVEVHLPDPQALVTFNGQNTVTRGTERRYVTPGLQVGKNYHYNITATWRENSRQVNRGLQVRINAGRLAVADFTRPVLTATESR